VDQHKTNLRRFFRRVDDALQAQFGGDRAPLVLGAVDYLQPIFRDASRYTALVEGGLDGNPEGLSPPDLHSRAWPIVEPYLTREQALAAERFQELLGARPELASAGLAEVLAAAHQGRVDTLFVEAGQRQWGTFDPAANQASLHAEQAPGDEDLLDLAAVQTFLFGGRVYGMEPGRVPGGGPVAAVFRY
jgi:hypothetical protein